MDKFLAFLCGLLSFVVSTGFYIVLLLINHFNMTGKILLGLVVTGMWYGLFIAFCCFIGAIRKRDLHDPPE
jgi:hypothetical protein